MKMKFMGIVIVAIMSICGAVHAKDRKPSQTGNFGKAIDPKSAATFQCLRDTETYIENTPVLKEYRAILMKKRLGADKVEAQKADESWDKMEAAITELRLNPCEIVNDEKFPR